MLSSVLYYQRDRVTHVQADVSRTFRDKGPLDPLVLSLMDFGTLEELSSKISQLYQV